eukprot:6313156-Alexandrium_andersonii.AAC.1
MEAPAKRRYTGRRARAKGQAASSSDAPPQEAHVGIVQPEVLADNSLVQSLLQKWSWGLLHATEVQDTSLRAYRDQQALLNRLGQSPELADALGEPSVPDPLFAK